jgi:membrane-bound metal-dependent hydrolase YbcI (DUF457 family)
MFIGHFGAGLVAKKFAPRVSLGTLFLSAQFIDLLWPTFLLFAPGETPGVPLAFEHYPLSHSLLAVVGWAVGVALVYYFLRREMRGAWVIGLAVLSHWVLDLVVHVPDLPLYPGDSPLLGFGLWQSVVWTQVVEFALLGLGVWLYTRVTKATNGKGRWGFAVLIAFLVIIRVGNVFGPPPPSVTAIAWVGQAQWLLVLWAYWVDRHRIVR